MKHCVNPTTVDSRSFRGKVKRLKGALENLTHPAVPLALGMKLVAPFTRALDRVLPGVPSLSALPPTLLIVGSPRSGGTMVYQWLVRAVPCSFLSNRLFLFPRRGGLTSPNLQGGACRSFYGYTSGVDDVNEGNEFLESLFDGIDQDRGVGKRFLELVSRITGGTPKPVILKNVRVFSRVGSLCAAVPGLQVLRIRRKREQVVQSFLKGFHELGAFHPMPREVLAKGRQSPAELAWSIIDQVESTLDLQLENVAQDRVHTWEYEDFCEEPVAHGLQVCDWLGVPRGDLVTANTNLKASFSRKVSVEEATEIRALCAQNKRERASL